MSLYQVPVVVEPPIVPTPILEELPVIQVPSENPVDETADNPSPEDSDVDNPDIIRLVDNQNQNAVYVQPQQSALGPQAQTSTIPETSLNSQSASLGTQDILFGDTTSAGPLLNQSQVLAAASSGTSAQASETYKPPENSANAAAGPILLAFVIILALSLVLKPWSNKTG